MSENPKLPVQLELNQQLPAFRFSIRPHHLLIRSLQNAFLGGSLDYEEIPNAIAGDPFEFYRRDVLGQTEKSKNDFLRNLIFFMEKLSQLENEEWILLSLEPDEICAGCAIGAHCIASNYKFPGENNPPTSTLRGEEENIGIIKTKLNIIYARENVDFFWTNTTHKLNDFNGSELTDPIFSEVDVLFKSLLVNVGILRTALDPDESLRNRYKLASLNASSTQE